MNYKEIEDKYINAGIKGYKLANASEFVKILGYDLRKIKGFKELSSQDKKLAESLICKYVNGYGLEAREKIRLTKIDRKDGKFVITFKDKTFNYLYDNGTVG